MGPGRRLALFPILLILSLFSGRVGDGLVGRGEDGLVARGPGRVAVPADSSAYWLFLDGKGWTSSAWAELEATIPGRIRARSLWLGAVSVQVPKDRVEELASLPRVRDVRRVGRLVGLPRRGSSPGGGDARLPRAQDTESDSVYGALAPALRLLEVPAAHALGFQGTGTRIGILGGYFSSDHVSLQGHPPIAVRDFVDSDESVEPELEDPLEVASQGTALWSLVGGDWPGHLIGAAPQAGVLLARIQSEADGVSADEDRWVAALEWLETQGARVVLSAVGFRDFEGGRYTQDDLNGDVAPATVAADEAARRGVLVVAPVGNDGPGAGTLQSPADGDSVLAVGAFSLVGTPSTFSAQGPTTDGRPKPELMALGEGLPAASVAGEESLGEFEGTEYAGALVAGAAALFVEAYPDRGPTRVVQALEFSVDPYRVGFPRMPRVAASILFPDGVWALPLEEVSPQGEVTNLAPRFAWNAPTLHPFGLPVTFYVEMAGDSLFKDLLLRDSVVGTFARRLQEPLPPRTTFFWRVQARSVQGVRWATDPEGPFQVPSWVTLDVLNDPSGTQIAELQPEFRWTALPLSGPAGPFTFELQLFSDRQGEVIQSYPDLQEERWRVEEPLPFNVPLRWRVIAEARTGAVDTVTSSGPFVVTGGESPPVTILYQNFPNPFPNFQEGYRNTRIWFDLAEEATVQLALYDMRGRLVRSLIPAAGCGPVELPPGLYGREEGGSADPCVQLTWDARDDRGRFVSPGVYLLRLRAHGKVEVRRVVYWP